MKTASEAISTGTFQALNGNISVSGQPIRVFNPRIDDAPGNYYLIILSADGKEEDDKTKSVRTHSLELQAVAKFGPYEGGYREVNDIINQASVILNSKPYMDLSPEYQVFSVKEEGFSSSTSVETPVESLFIKTMRLELKININQ